MPPPYTHTSQGVARIAISRFLAATPHPHDALPSVPAGLCPFSQRDAGRPPLRKAESRKGYGRCARSRGAIAKRRRRAGRTVRPMLEGEAGRAGACTWGIDLGTNAAQSAVAAFWPETGRLEVLAAFPAEPSFAERGLRDGVGRLYDECARRGELISCGGAAVVETREQRQNRRKHAVVSGGTFRQPDCAISGRSPAEGYSRFSSRSACSCQANGREDRRLSR